MSVEVAEKAGFCFGVDRAVKMAYEHVARGERVFTYGQLIHNRDVTDDLQSKGVGCIENLDEVRAGDIVIIRAHGVSKKEMEILEGKGAKVVDATCPYVKNIHKIVRREYEAGRECGEGFCRARCVKEYDCLHRGELCGAYHAERDCGIRRVLQEQMFPFI